MSTNRPSYSPWKRKLGVEFSGLEPTHDFLVAISFFAALGIAARVIAFVAFRRSNEPAALRLVYWKPKRSSRVTRRHDRRQATADASRRSVGRPRRTRAYRC